MSVNKKKFGNLLIFLILICMELSCGYKGKGAWELNKEINQELQSYLEVVANTDPCLGENESFDDMAKRMSAVRNPLDQIDNVTLLKAIYIASNKRFQEEPPRKERCGSAYFTAQEKAIERVGEIGNKEAAAFLMELYNDENRKFHGTSRAVMGKAMVSCGENILPLIEPVKDLRKDIGPRVVSSIKNKTPF